MQQESQFVQKMPHFFIVLYHLSQAQHTRIKLRVNSQIAVDLTIDLKVWIFVRGIPYIPTEKTRVNH